MTQPKIELRKISHNQRLSEETPAYAAQLWVDGVYFADVSNHGQGGCDNQHPAKGKTFADLEALDARIKAAYPKQSYFAGGEKHEYETNLELLCHLALGRVALEKTIKRDLAKKIMFIKPSDGKLYGVKLASPAHRDIAIKAVKERHGIDRTINEMTLDEAIKIYEAA